MRITKIAIAALLFTFTMGCNSDDDNSFVLTPERDRAEVYAEDKADIDTFLDSYYYNESQFNHTNLYAPENDTFELEFIKVDLTASPKPKVFTDIIDNSPNQDDATKPLKFKTIVDFTGQEYKLYYLVLRKGKGQQIHPLDKAIVTYKGFKIDPTIEKIEDASFDKTSVPINFSLVTPFGTSVIEGFKDGLIEFGVSTGFTESADGSIVYKEHGIGAVFVPSGLGYFSRSQGSISPYTPLVFAFNAIDRNSTDFDSDNVPSHLEAFTKDSNGAYVFSDSDSDGILDYIDNDDDNDGVLTKNEDLEDTDATKDSDGDGNFTNDKNGDGNPLNDDSDNDTIPNFLDTDSKESKS